MLLKVINSLHVNLWTHWPGGVLYCQSLGTISSLFYSATIQNAATLAYFARINEKTILVSRANVLKCSDLFGKWNTFGKKESCFGEPSNPAISHQNEVNTKWRCDALAAIFLLKMFIILKGSDSCILYCFCYTSHCLYAWVWSYWILSNIMEKSMGNEYFVWYTFESYWHIRHN